jgi:hypothetical protein
VTDAPLNARVKARLHRHHLDTELAAGVDPNVDPAHRERAEELLADKSRRRLAGALERLLGEADSGPSIFSPKIPIAKEAVRDCRLEIETLVERLDSPAFISAQGVAKLGLMLSDGASPIYSPGLFKADDPKRSEELSSALEATIEAIDHGPVIVG